MLSTHPGLLQVLSWFPMTAIPSHFALSRHSSFRLLVVCLLVPRSVQFWQCYCCVSAGHVRSISISAINNTYIHTYIHTYKLYSRPKKAFQRIQKERKKKLNDNIFESKIKIRIKREIICSIMISLPTVAAFY